MLHILIILFFTKLFSDEIGITNSFIDLILSFKLLFPGSYMNLGVNNLNGDVTNIAGNVELSNDFIL